MKQDGKTRAWAGLVVTMLALVVALVASWPIAPAHAAARQRSASGDALTLSITNGSTFQYDAFPGPRFHLVLVLAAPWSGPSTMFTGLITLGDGQQMTANFSGPASDAVTYTADVAGDRDNSGKLINVGDQTATATLTNPVMSAPPTSNQVSFTITKLNMTMSCGMGGSSDFLWKPGQTEQVTLTAQNTDGNVPVDWTQGTVTVWFAGPSTVTYANLQPDSSGVVTVTTPSQIGEYSLNCSFTGTTYYAAQEVTPTRKSVVISEMQKVGAIHLYTSPTTLVANQTTQMYIVFQAGPGLPTPTGQFNIYIGTTSFYYTPSIQIGAGGTASLTLNPIANLHGANNITIHYYGDAYYDNQSVNFTLTNPPIPGSGGAPKGGGSASKATITPSATTTTTTGGIAEGSASGTSGATPSAPSPSVLSSLGPFSGFGLIALLVVLGLALVGGGAGVYLYLSRRASQPMSPAQQMPQTPELAQPYRDGEYDEDTLPRWPLGR